MSKLTAENVVYMVQNLVTGEFLANSQMKFTANVWDVSTQGRFPNREAAKKARTQARTALASDVNPVAIDIVRVRADVRRGTRGRPRKIAE
jgi:hypothetical protein